MKVKKRLFLRVARAQVWLLWSGAVLPRRSLATSSARVACKTALHAALTPRTGSATRIPRPHARPRGGAWGGRVSVPGAQAAGFAHASDVADVVSPSAFAAALAPFLKDEEVQARLCAASHSPAFVNLHF